MPFGVQVICALISSTQNYLLDVIASLDRANTKGIAVSDSSQLLGMRYQRMLLHYPPPPAGSCFGD